MADNQGYSKGLKWFKFYTSFYLPVFLFLSGLALFGDISALFFQKRYSYYPASELYTYVFLGLILELITFCLQISSFVRLRNDNEKSFATNNAYLIFLCIFSAYKAALGQVRFEKYSSFSNRVVVDTSSVTTAFVSVFALLFLVWFVPNYFYFKNRQDYLRGSYVIAPSQDILSMFDEIKGNPQAVKIKAREMREAGGLNVQEYFYVIQNYVDHLNGDTTVYLAKNPLDRFKDISDNPEMIKAQAKDLLRNGEITSKEYIYIINNIHRLADTTVSSAESPQESQTEEHKEDNTLSKPAVEAAVQTPDPVKTCLSCGAPLIEGASFCNKCGKKLN